MNGCDGDASYVVKVRGGLIGLVWGGGMGLVVEPDLCTYCSINWAVGDKFLARAGHPLSYVEVDAIWNMTIGRAMR